MLISTSNPQIINTYRPSSKDNDIEALSFSFQNLLKPQAQFTKKHIDQFFKFSKTDPSHNLSTALAVLDPNASVKAKGSDYLNDTSENEKPIREIFDQEGRIVQIISSDGTVNYRISYEGHITTVINTISGETHLQESDTQGRLIREVLPCGLEISFKFDGDYLSEVILPDQSKVSYQVIDSEHVIVKRISAKGTTQYQHAYHSVGDHLLAETLIGKAGTAYKQYDVTKKTLITKSDHLCILDQYDKSQNLISRILKGPSEQKESTTLNYPVRDLLAAEQRQLDGQHRVTQYNGYTCSYDDQGRLMQKVSADLTVNYTYDALGRMTSVDMGEGKVEYTYDLSGRRLSKNLTENGETYKEFYLYQGVNQIGVYNEVKKPIHQRILGAHGHTDLPLAVAIESEGKVYAPIYSSHYNILQLVDQETQEVIHYESLKPFGDNLQEMAPICPWIFATKHFDSDTGLFDFGDRQYDPSIKQWTSADPDSRALASDLYTYCNNNPLKYIDPDGRFVIFIPLTQGLWPAVTAILTAAAAFGAKKGVDKINEEQERKRVGRRPPFNGAELGSDPTKCPGPGFEWKGNGPPESGKGSWVKGNEKLHPDLNHGDPVGPHWDYEGPNFPNPGIRLKPNGTWEYKPW